MFMKRRRGKKCAETAPGLESLALSKSLEENVAMMEGLFKDDDTFKLRYVQNIGDNTPKYALVFVDGLVNSSIINDNIIRPLEKHTGIAAGKGFLDVLIGKVIQIGEVQKAADVKEIVDSVTYGDTILFVEGQMEAAILNTKSFTERSISEPESEKTLVGPREGFSEALMTNLSLVRRKLRTNDLKLKFITFGKRTNTTACICYVDGIAKKEILDELYMRLEKIEIDGVLDTNYLSEMIREPGWTPFKTIGMTERPDVVVGRILEGRIAIFLDGTPVVLTVPFLFIENFQNAEDYYLNFVYSPFTRLLRMFGMFMTMTIPSLYIAVVAYQQETIPTNLLISITMERRSAPLPAIAELLVMLLVFEIIKESGVRMPSSIGQALSIVGALVIGDAAVQANLVASPMIIVVAVTGITGLMIPKMNSASIYTRLFLLVCTSSLGIFGFALGLSVVALHITNLKSFGVHQIDLTGNFKYQEYKDLMIRASWRTVIERPKDLTADKIRARYGGVDD